MRCATAHCEFFVSAQMLVRVKSSGGARAGAAAFCYVDAAERQDGSDRSQQQLRRHEEPLAELHVHHACVLCCDGDGAAPLPTAKLAAGCGSCRELRAAACDVLSDHKPQPEQPGIISSMCGLMLARRTKAAEVVQATYVTRCIVRMGETYRRYCVPPVGGRHSGSRGGGTRAHPGGIGDR